MDRVARRGPLARAPGALKRGHFRNCQLFGRCWRRNFWRKNKFSKSLTMPKNWKAGSFGIFKHPMCCENQRKWRGDPLERKKIRKKVSQCRKLKRGPFGVFQHQFCRKTSKIEVGKLFYFPKKNLTVPKKLKEGTLCDFPTSILTQKAKKLKRETFGKKEFSEEKTRSDRKKMKRGTAEKQEKLFWLNSQGQMVQFGAIVFCRTFGNYFGQFVWI